MLRSGGGSGIPGPPGAAGAPGTPGQTVGNALLDGGGVVATGNLGLTVAAAEYQIVDTSYTSSQTNLTLSAADPSNARIDVIALNTSGAAVVVEGTAAANPFEPVLDPATQLRLTAITVGAGATAISFTNTIIFTEGGGESWTETASGAPISVANGTSPITGSVDCKATSGVNGNYMQFANGSDFDTTTRNLLSLTIKNNSALPNQKSLVAQWYDGTIARGTPVTIRNGTFGFIGSDLTTEQVVPIPMQAFGVGGLAVDTLRLTITGGGSAWSFQVDDIFMQAGIVQAQQNDAMRFRGTYSASVQYTLNDVVVYKSGLYWAGAPVLGTAPGSSPWIELVYGAASGTSFPSSPVDDQRFYRSDINQLCFYDSSATKWLSANEYTVVLWNSDVLQPFTNNGTVVGAPIDYGSNGFWLCRWIITTYSSTTADASNYWTIQPCTRNANATNNNAGTSYNNSLHTLGIFVRTEVNVEAAIGADQKLAGITITKTGTPGSIYVLAQMVYRRAIT